MQIILSLGISFDTFRPVVLFGSQLFSSSCPWSIVEGLQNHLQYIFKLSYNVKKCISKGGDYLLNWQEPEFYSHSLYLRADDVKYLEQRMVLLPSQHL